jgi:acyl-[acyl-carrier-protein] desaturase
MLARVALDENLHMLFYRNLMVEAIRMEPNATMRAIADVLTNFQMPGAGMPGWGRKSVQIALAGIYDLKLHLEDVVMPVLRAWGIFDLETLTGDGAVAREELAEYLNRSTADVNLFVDKRETHFEKMIARGIEPLRIK